jgi:hypothetical protein
LLGCVGQQRLVALLASLANEGAAGSQGSRSEGSEQSLTLNRLSEIAGRLEEQDSILSQHFPADVLDIIDIEDEGGGR